MKNITKSVKALSRVIEILLGDDSATSSERALADVKANIYRIL